MLVFFWQATLDSDAQTRAVYALGSIPAVLFDIRELPPDVVMVPAWASVPTSMFLHGGWMHLLGFLIQAIYMPASLVLVLWLGLQLLSSWLSSGQEGGVAFGAHIGGFVAGLLLIPLFKRRGVPLLAPPRR